MLILKLPNPPPPPPLEISPPVNLLPKRRIPTRISLRQHRVGDLPVRKEAEILLKNRKKRRMPRESFQNLLQRIRNPPPFLGLTLLREIITTFRLPLLQKLRPSKRTRRL